LLVDGITRYPDSVLPRGLSNPTSSLQIQAPRQAVSALRPSFRRHLHAGAPWFILPRKVTSTAPYLVEISINMEVYTVRSYAAVPIRTSCTFASVTAERVTENASTNPNTIQAIASLFIGTRNKRSTGARRMPTAKDSVRSLMNTARRPLS
jgi:hypothetical protein